MDKILPAATPSLGIVQAVTDFNYVWDNMRGGPEDRAMLVMNMLGILYAPVPQFHPIPEEKVEDELE